MRNCQAIYLKKIPRLIKVKFKFKKSLHSLGLEGIARDNIHSKFEENPMKP